MKRNLIYIIGVVCMMTSCVEESTTYPNISYGDEVTFSAALNKATTKTLYDEEQLLGNTSNVKVNWVHGDLITVFGAQCTGNNQAEYKVGTVSVDGNNSPILNDDGTETPVSGQNYANYLNKTGATGVQWGTATESDFFALYPSTTNAFESTDTGAKINTSIRTIQTNLFTYNSTSKTWVGTPYVNSQSNTTMPDALMYACTPNASVEKEYVDLNFKPWSTVLKFRFGGITYGTGADNSIVSITKITLEAPKTVDIAGDLTLEINKSTGKATATPDGKEINNQIVIYPNNLPLTSGQAVEFCVFTIPQEGLYFGVDADKDLWKVTIESSHGSFTYKMRPSSGNATIAAGKIHKVSIPAKEVVKEADLPPGNWIEKIPRNVYLTELSIPGAWYCLDDNYQTTTKLASQYAKGIRAFHLDCRLTWNKGSSKNEGSLFNPNYVYYPDSDAQLRLVVSGTEDANSINHTNNDPGDLVSTYVSTITNLVTEKEYAVLVLNIAEKPCTANKTALTGGGYYTYGTIDPAQVIPAIYTMLNNAGTKIYGNEEGEVINANTLVNDVLNHLIVKINVNTTYDNFITYTSSGPALVSEASMLSNSNYKEQDYMVMGNFTSMNESSVSWGSSATNPSLVSYSHQAQLTLQTDDNSTTPSYDDRKKAIDDIILRSEQIYSNNQHNGWYQIGIGGYVDTKGDSDGGENREYVTQNLMPYLKDWINDKISGNTRVINNETIQLSPSPVGVVLMNHCTSKTSYTFTNSKGVSDTASCAGLVDAIIRMNTKFYLNRDHSKPEWPDQTTSNQATQQNAAYATVGSDAF